jgi:hypothetical protein
MNVFQNNCLRLVGGEYPIKLYKPIKQTIKSHYDINEPITLYGKNGSRLDLEKSVQEFYLFNSLCLSYKNINKTTLYTKEEVSLLFLEIVGRLTKYLKFYYTLINYNLPDKVLIKDIILSELLIMFDISLDDLIKDDLIYYETGSWKLKGQKSLLIFFKYINYLDLLIVDAKQQIQDSFSII